MSDAVNNAPVSDPDSPSEATPIPSRYKWLKRFTKIGVLLIIFVIILRIGWGMIAQRRLDTLIESYRAAGQLVTAAEFDAKLDAVPDDENAAVLYEEAMEYYTGGAKAFPLLVQYHNDESIIVTQPRVADAFMQANVEALAIVRRATERPQVAWSHRLQGPRFASLSMHRMLAKVLSFTSGYQLMRGNCEGAVDTLYDFVSFSDATGEHPMVISSLVSWACHDLCFSYLEKFGEELLVSKRNGTIHEKLAKREQVERLIELLLDERRCRQAAIRGCHADRAHSLSQSRTWEDIGQPPLGQAGGVPTELRTSILRFIAHPVVVLDMRRQAEYYTRTAAAISERTWVAALQHFSADSLAATVLRRSVRPVSFSAGYRARQGMYQRICELFFRHIARRRMAAVALAIKLYEVDHRARPPELSALVPDYLAEVPPDPFANGEDTFIYKPLAVRPLLYSVGTDGSDDGGEAVRNASGNWTDILFFLAPELPEEADDESDSSLEAGDDGEQVEQQ